MDAPVPIRAITFDLDDTLWAIDPVIERAEQCMHAWLGQRYPRLSERYTPAGLRELRDQLATEQPQLAHDLSILRLESLALAAAHCGYGREAAEGAFDVMWRARNEVQLFDDVLPVLTVLADRLPLGALTNGNADIALVGLDHVLRFSVTARAVGVAKPELGMFQAASSAVGVPVQEILHVGDDPLRDVFGARAAGMRTVWVNRDSRTWPGGLPADAEVTDLHGLLDLLVQWQVLPGV